VDPADLTRLRLPGAPTVSPDGRSAVVALTRLDLEADDYTSQLWLVPTGGGEPRQLTHGWRDAEPRYSPDGRWLAFTRAARDDHDGGRAGRPQLYVLPVDGGEARRLTDHPLGVAGGAAWSPDSTRLAYVARVPEPGRYGTEEKTTPDREPPRRITRLFYRVDGLGFLLDRPRHVFVTPLDGEPAQVTDGDADHADVDWSPTDELLTFAAARHDERYDDLVGDVWVAAPDGSGLRALTDTTLSVSLPRFSADGASVWFSAVDAGPSRRDVVAYNEVLWSAPVDGSAPAAARMDREVYNLAAPGGRPVRAEDGMLFPNEHRGTVQLLLVPYDGGQPRVLVDGERQVDAAQREGGVLVATVADPQTWGDLIAVVDGEERRLTDWSAEYRAAVPVLAQHELTGTAVDGYPVPGWLVRPTGEGPHPVLLMIHGGPFTQYGWRLFDEAQVYAGAGYAVVMGNPRGSSGYGEAHGRAILGDVGQASAADLLALLDAALKDPSLDASRVGVLGGSHGGFMTTWLAAHHGERFRAAISERAVNAIDSFAGSSDIGWFFADTLYRDTGGEQSPLTHAHRIEAPFLIIHSEQDWRCPVEQAQRL
jgi:dipeptidyl aminopeptidase/acylaminoacyl peptidase